MRDEDEEVNKSATLNISRWVNSDLLWVISLSIAAIVLYTSSLGDVALRDWDEGIVAGVARNIWRAEPGSYTWLYPTINYGEPYWNKPPLIHWAIALGYWLFGVSEWSTRIVPALLSAFTVPLVYLIGREIWRDRITSLCSAIVYLTLLPIARHGRLAMLDGAIACWFCLAVWCVLRSRNPACHLGTGIALGFICLTKGIMMGVLLGGIVFIFIVWDRPKLLQSPYLWLGLMLGILPAVAWYGAQYQRYGGSFIGTSLGSQTFDRIWDSVGKRQNPPWYYLLEIAKYTLPWLIFLPYGIKLAYQQRCNTWAKLSLIWAGVYLLAISVMATKLPWYVIPIYPAFSLLIGASLAIAWRQKQFAVFWQVSVSAIAFICWLATAYYAFFESEFQLDLSLVLFCLAVSLTFASILLWLKSRYFIPAIAGGFYLTLLLLFNSPHWLWELNETFPVKPVAQTIREHTPPATNIYTSYPDLRPSLEFYSDRTIIPQSPPDLQRLWQQSPVYFLITSDVLSSLNLEHQQVLASGVSWQLITRRDN